MTPMLMLLRRRARRLILRTVRQTDLLERWHSLKSEAEAAEIAELERMLQHEDAQS